MGNSDGINYASLNYATYDGSDFKDGIDSSIEMLLMINLSRLL